MTSFLKTLKSLFGILLLIQGNASVVWAISKGKPAAIALKNNPIGKGAILHFSWQDKIGLDVRIVKAGDPGSVAIFQRGQETWIVVPNVAQVELPENLGNLKVQRKQAFLGKGEAFVITHSRAFHVSLNQAGQDEWRVQLTLDRVAAPRIRSLEGQLTRTPGRFTFEWPKAQVLGFEGREAEGDVYVVPVEDAYAGIPYAFSMPQIQGIPTYQGFVVVSLDPRVKPVQAKDKIEFSSPGGIFTSLDSRGLAEKQEWVSALEVLENSKAQESDAFLKAYKEAGLPLEKLKYGAQLAARYIQENKPQEALDLLNELEDFGGEDRIQDPQHGVLKVAALWLLGRAQEALSLIEFHRDLPLFTPWRGVSLIHQGQHEAGLSALGEAVLNLTRYPTSLKAAFGLTGLKAAFAADTPEKATPFLEILKEAQEALTPEQDNLVTLVKQYFSHTVVLDNTYKQLFLKVLDHMHPNPLQALTIFHQALMDLQDPSTKVPIEQIISRLYQAQSLWDEPLFVCVVSEKLMELCKERKDYYKGLLAAEMVTNKAPLIAAQQDIRSKGEKLMVQALEEKDIPLFRQMALVKRFPAWLPQDIQVRDRLLDQYIQRLINAECPQEALKILKSEAAQRALSPVLQRRFAVLSVEKSDTSSKKTSSAEDWDIVEEKVRRLNVQGQGRKALDMVKMYKKLPLSLRKERIMLALEQQDWASAEHDGWDVLEEQEIPEALDILKLAMALFMQGSALKAKELRQDYGDFMEGTPYQGFFQAITLSLEASKSPELDMSSLEKHVQAVHSLIEGIRAERPQE